ncbi:hypothetical protein CTI14_55315, partial [Methylobacterium radiotolerans]
MYQDESTKVSMVSVSRCAGARRLVLGGQAHVAHDFRPEAAVQQVQNGVLDAAGVQIHGQQVGLAGVEGAFV